MHHILRESRTPCLLFETALRRLKYHFRSHPIVATNLLIIFFFFFFWRVAFTSYGAFWLSFACFFIPGAGIGDAYKAAPKGMEDDAIGIYLMAWMTLTALFL